MPKFPRFTSGTFGRLDFATMNDLFDRVEQLESSIARQRGGMPQRQSEVVLCYVLSVSSISSSCMKATWTAAVPNTTVPCNTNLTAYPSRSSTGPGGSSDYPLYGKNLAVNQSYLAHSVYLDDGSLIYRAIEEGAGSLNFAFGAVTGATVIAADKKWRYDLVEVEVLANGTFTPKNPQVNFSAVNGCEEMPDPTPPSTGLYGVGFNPPSGLTQCKRMPIRNGIVVPCFQSGAGWGFSIPNGYSIVC